MRQALWRLGWAAGLAMLAGVAGGQQIAVDDSDGPPTYTETGSWTTTTNTGAGYNGTLYRFTRSTSPASTATWRPTLPTAGAWEVLAVFRRSGDRTNRAPYTIHHLDGTTVVELDQTGSFSGDLAVESLGAYRFGAGTGGRVVLSNNGGAGVYIADAMLWRPDAGPVIANVRRAPLYVGASDSVLVTARVTDNGTVASVSVEWSVPGLGLSGSMGAADDGTGGDVTAGDGVFSALLAPRPDGQTVRFRFVAEDNLGTVTTGDFVEYVVGQSGDWQLVINEVMASNRRTTLDPDFGAAADWVELYNVGPDPADLTGLTLSDSAGNPTKWAFPAGTTLESGAYLLVWCDGTGFVGDGLHTTFALSASGEDIVLFDTRTQTVLDQTNWPALGTDEAWARFPNVTGPFAHTILPTPGEENMLGTRGPAPTFSVASGFQNAPIAVTISAPGASAIRYTTNGATPGPASPLYTGPVAISTTTGLRARAWYPDTNPSRVTSASYFYIFEADRQIPVINLVVDPDDLFNASTGIYTNFNSRGFDWEKPAHVLLMGPDGSGAQSIDAGLRIHGGFSRSAAKRSFRLYFRTDYGASEWSVPWLERSPLPAIRQLVLRAGGNDGFLVTASAQLQEVTYIRDQLMRDWFHEQGHYAADGFFVALYLNGQYWGLYNATERITADQMGEVVGPDGNQDIAKGTWTFATKFYTEATDGDLVAWNELLAWHANANLATDADLAALKTRIDYRNFLDFFALNIFCQNEDWPHNNWIASRHRTATGARWIFHEWDSEWGLGLRPQGWSSNTLRWAQGDNFHLSTSHNGTIAPLSNLFNGNDLDTRRTRDINGILDNATGRRDFIAAMENLLNFEVDPTKATADFDRYVAQIASEIPREANRWGGQALVGSATLISYWNAAVPKLRSFLANRPAATRTMMVNGFGLAGTRRITFAADGDGTGRLLVRGRMVDLPWTGTFFAGSTVELSAIADPGARFEAWTGHITGTTADVAHVITAGTDATVTINFAAATTSDWQPNDVIFNEYWVNDDGTFYDSIGAAIDRDWFELLVVRDGVDMRGWRITGNTTVDARDEAGSGSIILPDLPVLASLPAGTIILIVSSINDTNNASFPSDDLDLTDRRLIFYAGNGHLDLATDAGFGIGTGDDALVLLAPGASTSFADDIGIDFIAEGTRITPASFFRTATPPVVFHPPFEGIGNDDGALFQNDPTGGFNNDNGADPNRTDFLPGPGGWVVDPPAQFTGDSNPVIENRLTPGAPNWGQDLTPLRGAPTGSRWVVR